LKRNFGENAFVRNWKKSREAKLFLPPVGKNSRRKGGNRV